MIHQAQRFAAVLLCTTALLTPLHPTAAQTNVFTDPVGFITLTAVGTNGISGKAYSLLGLGLTRVVTNRGVITAVSGTKITLNNSLTSGQFNSGSQGPLYFIEVTSGSNAGLADDIVSNDTAAVFTANDDSSLVASGQTYKIYPHWTLASVFGPNNEAGLQQGTSSTADQILIQNPLTQQFTSYFYSNGGKSGIGWRSATGGSVDQANTPLYIDQGILVNKQTATNIAVKLVGAVKLGQTIIPIGATNTLLGNVYATSSITLSNSNLYTGDPATGLVGGTAGSADLVLIHDDVAGTFTTYFWSTGGKAGVGWRSATGGSTEMGATPIPLGGSVLLQLQPGRNGFPWFAQAPY